MIKKTITFRDYNDVEHVETDYFHLNKLELIRLETFYKDGLEDTVKNALKENDHATVLSVLEKIILTSYGKKNDEDEFIKSKAATEAFEQSDAYAEMVIDILSDPTGGKFAEFFKGVIPKEYANNLPAQPAG